MNSLKEFLNHYSGYNLIHVPFAYLPERPALCSADDFEISYFFNDYSFVFQSKFLIFHNPLSMTILIPGIVNDV